MVGLLITNSCKKDDIIIKKDVVITWTNPEDIVLGTALSETQLNATADLPGTFVYTPPVGTVLGAGASQNLKVDFIPNDATNYNTATKTVAINVIEKNNPVITWENPEDIVSGTPLSETQLNATADLPGTFIYTPPIGTVLDVGANQNLKVDFTPTDITNYNTATKTVTINVTEVTTVTDYDGNVYQTIVIGTQTWMVENLKVTHYRNGDEIDNITDNTAWIGLTDGAYCWYDNDIANKADYGALYNWYAVADSRNIAPTGWHVPIDSEWSTLITFLLGAEVAGGKMKETGFAHWDSPNTGATNQSGFTALPGGYRYGGEGTFARMGGWGYWWSNTPITESSAWYRWIESGHANAYRIGVTNTFGFSIRCLKD